MERGSLRREKKSGEKQPHGGQEKVAVFNALLHFKRVSHTDPRFHFLRPKARAIFLHTRAKSHKSFARLESPVTGLKMVTALRPIWAFSPRTRETIAP